MKYNLKSRLAADNDFGSRLRQFKFVDGAALKRLNQVFEAFNPGAIVVMGLYSFIPSFPATRSGASSSAICLRQALS